MSDPLAETRRWIERIVIGLNLCPFARRPFDGDRIRYVLSDATDLDSLRKVLENELKSLAAAPREEVETTLIVHPGVLQDFLDYNDFVVEANDRLAEWGYEGVIQIASFHPQYRFAGASDDDPANATNRSPYPMLHLLREDSVTEAAESGYVLDGIPARNVLLLRKLGRAGLDQLIHGDSP